VTNGKFYGVQNHTKDFAPQTDDGKTARAVELDQNSRLMSEKLNPQVMFVKPDRVTTALNKAISPENIEDPETLNMPHL
jgi:hypothetical protein